MGEPRSRRHEPYQGPSGRAAGKRQAEALAEGRSLDLRAVRAATRSSPLWAQNRAFNKPFKRSHLIDDLNRLARHYAQPFLLGDFDHEADIAPLSSAVADLAWIKQSGARRDSSTTPAAYSQPVLELAKSSDIQTNQPDKLFGTVADGYLELFFDWILPLACINGHLRGAAMTQLKPAFSDITGRPRKLVNDNLKKLGGKEINAQITRLSGSREAAGGLVGEWSDGSLRLEPDEAVVARFWSKLDQIASSLEQARYRDEATHIRREVHARWGLVLPPDEKATDRDRPDPHAVLMDDVSLLEIYGERADRRADRLEDPDADARNDSVDRAIDQIGTKLPDLEEYERACDSLATVGGPTQADSPSGSDAGSGSQRCSPALDPEAAALALWCLQRALETNFANTGKGTWRAFAQRQLTARGATTPVDRVVRAAAAIACEALRQRRAPTPPETS